MSPSTYLVISFMKFQRLYNAIVIIFILRKGKEKRKGVLG
jgi:hypothetical protein